MLTDLRAAVAGLLSARAFTSVAVLTLAAGLALATVILSVVNAYVLRSLPYPEADRLYGVTYGPPGEPWPEDLEQLDWASLDEVIEMQIAWDLDGFHLLGGDYPESAQGAWVTEGFISALGVPAARGRTLTPQDFQPGSPAVALISHRLWQTRFGGDPAIVGTSFDAYVNDRPDTPEAFTIVGVLPADFWHVNAFTEVLAPLKARTFPYQVRIREGVAPAMAAQRIESLIREAGGTLPPNFGVALTSLQESYTSQLTPMFSSVAAGAALVLLIASANVAVLMIARGRKRERELAVRLALGATHARVVRLVAFEGLVIGVASTMLGVAAASFVVPALGPFLEQSFNRRVPGGLAALSVDPFVLTAGIACGVLVTVAFTAIPILMLWRSRHSLAALGTTRGASDGSRSSRSRAVLIAVEVAASLTLIAGASMMIESALRMLRVEFGIKEEGVATAMLSLRQASFPEPSDLVAFYERLERELPGNAGATHVAVADYWPLQPAPQRRVETAGAQPVTGTANPLAVSSQYFEALNIRLRDGRVFNSGDRPGGEAVAVVSESLAAQLWPRARAVGQRLTFQAEGQREAHSAVVIGVVGDVRQSHNDLDLRDAYLSLAQRPSPFGFLYVRGARDGSWDGEVRAAIARVDADVALGTMRPLGDALQQERARPSLLAYLLSAFAIIACVLALVGMYGVITFAVRQRQREIAIRMAVGADARAVTAMFLRYGVAVLGAGLAVGLAGALGLGRLLQSQLYGVRAAEPRILALAALAFGLVALAAVVSPARRAAAVDPSVLLRDD